MVGEVKVRQSAPSRWSRCWSHRLVSPSLRRIMVKLVVGLVGSKALVSQAQRREGAQAASSKQKMTSPLNIERPSQAGAQAQAPRAATPNLAGGSEIQWPSRIPFRKSMRYKTPVAYDKKGHLQPNLLLERNDTVDLPIRWFRCIDGRGYQQILGRRSEIVAYMNLSS